MNNTFTYLMEVVVVWWLIGLLTITGPVWILPFFAYNWFQNHRELRAFNKEMAK